MRLTKTAKYIKISPVKVIGMIVLLSKLRGLFETNNIFRSVFANRDDMTAVTDSDIKALQGVLIGIMEDIDAVCRKNEITYFLAGGSALGAVRESGFIPWDDDMDIIVPRKDYLRFLECIATEFPDRYTVQCVSFGMGYDMHSAKIRKKGTVYTELFESEKGKTGVFIDVYPLEDTYDSSFRRKLHGYKVEALMLICSCIKMKKNSKLILPYLTEKEHIKAVKRKVRLGKLLSVLPLEKWLKITEKSLSKVKNPESEFVTVPSGVGHYFKETYRRDDFFPAKDISFEGRHFSIMNNPSAYLIGRYGEDYMTPPDEKNRYEHHAVMEFKL